MLIFFMFIHLISSIFYFEILTKIHLLVEKHLDKEDFLM